MLNKLLAIDTTLLALQWIDKFIHSLTTYNLGLNGKLIKVNEYVRYLRYYTRTLYLRKLGPSSWME